MRSSFTKQLEALHTELITMGALCEDAISCAVRALIDGDGALREKVVRLESEIDDKEREIEDFCLRLLIREQPVAGDLRQIHAAQKLIGNMERIGDQALDIAEISATIDTSEKSDVHLADMAQAVSLMLQNSVDSFVARDAAAARAVIGSDDFVDALFVTIKTELAERIALDGRRSDACLDLLMIAKYLERIGDHAVNIAEQVVYLETGEHE